MRFKRFRSGDRDSRPREMGSADSHTNAGIDKLVGFEPGTMQRLQDESDRRVEKNSWENAWRRLTGKPWGESTSIPQTSEISQMSPVQPEGTQIPGAQGIQTPVEAKMPTTMEAPVQPNMSGEGGARG